jgi:hypothetical protein
MPGRKQKIRNPGLTCVEVSAATSSWPRPRGPLPGLASPPPVSTTSPQKPTSAASSRTATSSRRPTCTAPCSTRYVCARLEARVADEHTTSSGDCRVVFNVLGIWHGLWPWWVAPGRGAAQDQRQAPQQVFRRRCMRRRSAQALAWPRTQNAGIRGVLSTLSENFRCASSFDCVLSFSRVLHRTGGDRGCECEGPLTPSHTSRHPRCSVTSGHNLERAPDWILLSAARISLTHLGGGVNRTTSRKSCSCSNAFAGDTGVSMPRSQAARSSVPSTR